MGVKLFDRKFARNPADAIPTGPGIYLFRDDQGRVLYVGKAVNLRKRLASYRNASRRKTHRKMRTLVRRAAELEIVAKDSERAALLAENEIIRTLRPPFNVDGAYSFLYPVIGTGNAQGRDLLCFTTKPEAWGALDLQWHGAFRSRPRAREAFDSLIEVLALLAHPEPKSRMPAHTPQRGSRLVAFRQLNPALASQVHRYLAGESAQPLATLAEHLLEKPRARRDAQRVEECLGCLAAFYQSDLRKLRDALTRSGVDGTFIAQEQRDSLFISLEHA